MRHTDVWYFTRDGNMAYTGGRCIIRATDKLDYKPGELRTPKSDAPTCPLLAKGQ